MKSIKVIICLCLLGMALTTQAAGISVKPEKLNFILKASQTEIKTIVVENISAKPVIYNLYVDELDDQIYLAPANFRLEAGQKRQIKVQVSPKKAGLFSTNLSVLTQDLDRRTFNVATGVKIPLTIQVAAGPAFILLSWLAQTAALLLIPLVGIIIVLLIFLRRKRHWWEKIFKVFKKS